MTGKAITRREVLTGLGGAAAGCAVTVAAALAYREQRRQARLELMRAYTAATDTDDGWLISAEERAELTSR